MEFHRHLSGIADIPPRFFNFFSAGGESPIKPGMSRSRGVGLLLFLVTLAVYLPVLRNGFVNYDDGDYVTGNEMVQRGITGAGIKWAFTAWHASNWHPLTWLSHMTDCELFRLNPGRPSSDQSAVSCGERLAAFHFIAAPDRCAWGQARWSPRCLRGIPCTSSPSRGFRNARTF